MRYSQGDIIKVESLPCTYLIVSCDRYNDSEMAFLCPIISDVKPGPLHIYVESAETAGYAICESIKSIDLKFRGYSIIGSVDYSTLFEVTDAIHSIFDIV